VLVSEDNVSCKKWPIGRVKEVHLGKDGLVRTATVRIQKSTLTRPVQCLHRLEIESAAPQATFLFLNLDSVLSSLTEDTVGGKGGEDAIARSHPIWKSSYET